MFATFVTLAIIAFAIRGLRELADQDGAKVLAALQGRSWEAEPRPIRPVIVRFSSTRKAEVPQWRPVLRAAA